MGKQEARSLQGWRGGIELKPSAQTSLDELKELLALIKEHRIIHFPAQPRIETQFARSLELRFGAMTDIQVTIGRQFDEFAPVLWLVGMDKDDVNIRGAAKDGIDIRNQCACQVGGDYVLVVKSAFLGGLFGNSDQ